MHYGAVHDIKNSSLFFRVLQLSNQVQYLGISVILYTHIYTNIHTTHTNINVKNELTENPFANTK